MSFFNPGFGAGSSRRSVSSIFAIALALIICASCSRASSVPFYALDKSEYPLLPLNKAAKTGELLASAGDNGQVYAYFRFSKDLRQSALSALDGEAIQVLLDSGNGEPETVFLGLLYDEDFSRSGKLKGVLTNRPLSIVKNPRGRFYISMTADERGAAGVFVCARWSENKISGGTAMRALAFSAQEPFYGWSERAGEDPSYGFASEGGYFDRASPAVRVPAASADCVLLVNARGGADIMGSSGAQNRAVISRQAADGSSSRLTIRTPSAPYTARFSDVFFSSRAREFTVDSGAEFLDGMEIRFEDIGGESPLTPILCDPGVLLEAEKSNWRNAEYEFYAWDRFPSVIIFDADTYAVQSGFFKRLAFFVEKAGYRGTLLTDAELRGKHGYNAHDYRAESLAEFFSKAAAENFPLNRYEYKLRDVLCANGVIEPADGGLFKAGEGAVISISRESRDYLRYLFMAHEGFHGLYFTDSDFRAETSRAYASAPPLVHRFIETYFTAMDSLQYDVNDRYLMENEFMAYMLQRPVSEAAPYFNNTFAPSLERRGLAADAVEYMRGAGAADITRAAESLGEYVFSRWGLYAGRAHLVTVRK